MGSSLVIAVLFFSLNGGEPARSSEQEPIVSDSSDSITATEDVALFVGNAMVAHTESDTVTSAVADIDSITSVEEAISDEGITKKSFELFNPFGIGPSALDVVRGERLTIDIIDVVDNSCIYSPSDSSCCDIKIMGNFGQSLSVIGGLTSINGTRYVSLSPVDFDAATKSVRYFVSHIKALADIATELYYTESKPYLVAKLGGDRGYALVEVDVYSEYAGGRASLSGVAILHCYYVSNETVAEYQ